MKKNGAMLYYYYFNDQLTGSACGMGGVLIDPRIHHTTDATHY